MSTPRRRPTSTCSPTTSRAACRAVLGTHTHVPTADEQVLPEGTAFICDVGMTGPYDSILGRRVDRVLSADDHLRADAVRRGDGDVRLAGAIVDVDDATGKATAIRRVMVTEADVASWEVEVAQHAPLTVGPLHGMVPRVPGTKRGTPCAGSVRPVYWQYCRRGARPVRYWTIQSASPATRSRPRAKTPSHLSRPAPGEAYADLFDQVLDAVDDYFPIAYANRYEGRILGSPTIAAGYEQPWKPGSPDHVRAHPRDPASLPVPLRSAHREGNPTGYFVQVIVRKELKDYPSPAGQFTMVPVFGDAGTVDRDSFLVVDPDVTNPIQSPNERWIPKGRETALEQAILRKLQRGQ